MSAAPKVHYQLTDRYESTSATVYLTGLQCLLRAIVDHQRHQLTMGQKYGALVSGYPGSPMASFDKEFERIADLADALNIVHQQAVNEELAATALAGSQLAATRPEATVAGVIGLWYGKAPGVERAHDALKHANYVGAAPNGGVIVAAGDDPGCTSSTVPSASEGTLAEVFMPVLYPGSPQDVIDLATIGFAMSRYCGLWVAIKMVASVADAAGDVDVNQHRFAPARALAETPVKRGMTASLLPPGVLEVEADIMQIRLPAALEFARHNNLNPITGATQHEVARIAIVAAGRQYFDTRTALQDLGFVTNGDLAQAGIRLGKLDMIWPVDPDFVRRVAQGVGEIIVVEEKRGFVENQIITALYETDARPAIVGKRRSAQLDGFDSFGTISIADITRVLAQRLHAAGVALPEASGKRISALERKRTHTLIPLDVQREPWFCSGCPHNTSTVVPEGSIVSAGIGCHSMVMWMDPERSGDVIGLTQMGGEGANWVGMSPFVSTPHIFQNLGDGTFFHSGHLAVRAAVAANVNVTYKLLYNSAVAMTGGQNATGAQPVTGLCSMLLAEGVAKICVTTEDLDRYRGVSLPNGVGLFHRNELDAVQRRLAATPGVTVLIHDQECAAELRRKRKRGLAPTPRHKIVINQRICEGCGDCMTQSNCLSLESIDTPFGPKTTIDQASCNIDESCVRGDCPSFMEVTPGDHQRVKGAKAPTDLPEPVLQVDAQHCAIRIVGVGGTGIVTLSQLLGTATMLHGAHASGVDQTGLAQKGGPVISDVIITSGHDAPGSRVATASCDVLLVCDPIAGASARSLEVADPACTIACVSRFASPAGRMLIDRNLVLPRTQDIVSSIGAATHASAMVMIDAEAEALAKVGSAATANVLLLGFAYQHGLIPVSAAAIEQSIAVNGAAVAANLSAFAWGRALAHDPSLAEPGADDTTPSSVDFHAEMSAYQSAKYAQRFDDVVATARRVDAQFGERVSASLFKLMAYKDEYEVARLALLPETRAAIERDFGVDAKVAYRLHPPALRYFGMRSKLRLRRSAPVMFGILRAGKRLRGTPFDVFGYASVRRTERSLIVEYINDVHDIVARFDEFSDEQRDLARQWASLPSMIRGYEHIKMANVEAYRHERQRMLAELEPLLSTVASAR